MCDRTTALDPNISKTIQQLNTYQSSWNFPQA